MHRRLIMVIYLIQLNKMFATVNATVTLINGHIPKLFFRDADDFDSKTPSSIVEGVKKLVNVVLW